jgi:hypothetical protein
MITKILKWWRWSEAREIWRLAWPLALLLWPLFFLLFHFLNKVCP